MKRNFRICFACNKANSIDIDRCQVCNTPFDSFDYSGHFLTETFPSAHETVVLNEGSIINDRYSIKKLLGKGPSSKVYLAVDVAESLTLALKVSIHNNNESERHAHDLLPDGKMLQNIQDFSHIVQIFDQTIVPWEGARLLLHAMEYADGGSFREWLTRHERNHEKRINEGIAYFNQACHGISVLHQADTFHLDLKPENLLFFNGVMKVSDFDMASIIVPIVSDNAPNKKTPLHGRGSPVYMSPERFFSTGENPADTRMDIYALGIILYEIINPSGHPPFRGSFQRLKAYHNEAPVPAVPGIDERMNSIVKRCLQKDPNDRYQSVQDLIEDLENAHDKQGFSIHGSDNLTGEDDQQHDSIWDKVYLYYVRGDFNQALALLDELLATRPQHAKARIMRDELNERALRAQHIYDEIRNNPENDLKESIRMLKKAVEIYPNHPSGEIIQTKLAIAAEKYLEAMKKGFDAFQRNQWKIALEWFRSANKAHRIKPNLVALIEQLSRIVNAKDRIEAALAQPDYATAMHLAQWVDIQVEELKQQMGLFSSM